MNNSETSAEAMPADALNNVSSIRSGLRRAILALEGAVRDLADAEGHGHHPDTAAARRRSVAAAHATLERVIIPLADWRNTLAKELGEVADARRPAADASAQDDTPRERFRRLYDPEVWDAMPTDVQEKLVQAFAEALAEGVDGR